MNLPPLDLKHLDWSHVTKFSQTIAVILFVGVFVLGFFLGKEYEYHSFINALNAGVANSMPTQQGTTSLGEKPIADVTYSCDAGVTIHAIYRTEEVQLLLSDGRNLTVPQAISGSGARYANKDESFVFWNKGNTAFITEVVGGASKTTFANCVQQPIPE